MKRSQRSNKGGERSGKGVLLNAPRSLWVSTRHASSLCIARNDSAIMPHALLVTTHLRIPCCLRGYKEIILDGVDPASALIWVGMIGTRVRLRWEYNCAAARSMLCILSIGPGHETAEKPEERDASDSLIVAATYFPLTS